MPARAACRFGSACRRGRSPGAEEASSVIRSRWVGKTPPALRCDEAAGWRRPDDSAGGVADIAGRMPRIVRCATGFAAPGWVRVRHGGLAESVALRFAMFGFSTVCLCNVGRQHVQAPLSHPGRARPPPDGDAPRQASRLPGSAGRAGDGCRRGPAKGPRAPCRRGGGPACQVTGLVRRRPGPDAGSSPSSCAARPARHVHGPNRAGAGRRPERQAPEPDRASRPAWRTCGLPPGWSRLRPLRRRGQRAGHHPA